MPRDVKLIRVLISSPGDMADDRRVVQRVAEELNRSVLVDQGFRLEPITWQTHGAPDFADDPQGVLNRQLKDFDIYIGMIGHRFGTPTPRAGSGTEEEFDRAYVRWKEDHRTCRLMFYFNETPVSPYQLDPDQLAKVKAFRSRLGTLGGLYWTYSDAASELPELIRQHLLRAVRDYGNTWGPTAAIVGEAAPLSGTPAPDEVDTPLDLAADLEESTESVKAFFDRLTATMKHVQSELDRKNQYLEQEREAGTLTAAKARAQAREMAGSLRMLGATIDVELPLLKNNWSGFREKLLLVLAAVKTPGELAETMQRSQQLREILAGITGGGTHLKEVLSFLGSLSRDLRDATRQASLSLADLLAVFGQMVSQLIEIEKALEARLQGQTDPGDHLKAE